MPDVFGQVLHPAMLSWTVHSQHCHDIRSTIDPRGPSSCGGVDIGTDSGVVGLYDGDPATIAAHNMMGTFVGGRAVELSDQSGAQEDGMAPAC